MIAEHLAAGSRIESLSAAQVRQKEPSLAAVPDLAMWAPDDFALEPVDLARCFIQAAQANGATVLSGTVQRVLSIEVGQRPMTSNKQPLCGPIGTLDGLFAVVAHPGVILAPLLGSLCTQAVLAA